jgi:hypothetical protein
MLDSNPHDAWEPLDSGEVPEFPLRVPPPAPIVEEDITGVIRNELNTIPAPRELTIEFDELSQRARIRQIERPPGYWKLRNGKFVAMSEMDDEHLTNCIRMCERNAQSRGRRADPMAPGAYHELIQERDRRTIRLAEHAMFLRGQIRPRDESRDASSAENTIFPRARPGISGIWVARALTADELPGPSETAVPMDVEMESPAWAGGAVGGLQQANPVPENTEPPSVPGLVPEGAPKRRIRR